MKSIENNYCRLCSVLSNPFISGHLRNCDTPFYTTKSFVAIPALGPLCEGHSMIVSRSHFASLLSMDQNLRTEFMEQCLILSSAWKNGSLMFAEHGSSCIDKSGPCIAHTHVNVIPNVPEEIMNLEKYGHNLIANGSLVTLPKMKDAYFLIGRYDSWFLYDAISAPSQFIRQLLYSWFGLPHWDWRLYQNEDIASITLKTWNHLIRSEAI